MKRIFLISLCMVLLNTVALSAAESNIDLKIGMGYPFVGEYSPETPGIDGAISFNLGLDKYFALSLETGLNWVLWDEYPGEIRKSGNTGIDKKSSYALTLPLLLNAVIRFDLREKYFIMPYVAIGAGYSWSFFFHPDDKSVYGGFTWQGLAGVSIRLPVAEKIELILEAGYRGSILSDDNFYKLDMSGILARAGVRFNLGDLEKKDDETVQKDEKTENQ